SHWSPSDRPSQGSSLPILTEPHDELAPLHLIASGKQRRRYGQAGSAHLLEPPGEHKVESAMQEVAILFKTDRQRWFATRPRMILGDIGIIPEIKLCGERHISADRSSSSIYEYTPCETVPQSVPLTIEISAKCWSEWQDLNLRPPRPERGALPDCATLRLKAGLITRVRERPQAIDPR